MLAKLALNTEREAVWLLVTTLFPFKERDPVIETDPVNTWVLERLFPNTLLPEL